jgi:hypothetical protein
MLTVAGFELLAIGHDHGEGLEALVVERLAGLIEHAETEHDLFQPLELAVQGTQRAGRAGLGAADDVAFEEQFALRLRAGGEPEHGECYGRNDPFFHWGPPNVVGVYPADHTWSCDVLTEA